LIEKEQHLHISNWENDKSYPDINSIILLSEVLEVSVDNLIKGDVEQMNIARV